MLDSKTHYSVLESVYLLPPLSWPCFLFESLQLWANRSRKNIEEPSIYSKSTTKTQKKAKRWIDDRQSPAQYLNSLPPTGTLCLPLTLPLLEIFIVLLSFLPSRQVQFLVKFRASTPISLMSSDRAWRKVPRKRIRRQLVCWPLHFILRHHVTKSEPADCLNLSWVIMTHSYKVIVALFELKRI